MKPCPAAKPGRTVPGLRTDREQKRNRTVKARKIAASIKPGYVADENLARNFARAYAGMTMEEFYQYAVEFGQKKTESFDNMRYIDNFYIPMVEVVKYLYDNGFTIYVISGTERTTTRAIVANSPINSDSLAQQLDQAA